MHPRARRLADDQQPGGGAGAQDGARTQGEKGRAQGAGTGGGQDGGKVCHKC